MKFPGKFVPLALSFSQKYPIHSISKFVCAFAENPVAENKEPNKRKREEEQDDEIAGFIVKIEVSLGEIRDFIVKAEQSPIKDPKLMELLKNLKDADYDAQDLLEEYEIADRRRSEEAANSMPVRDTMCKNLKEVSKRLEAIKAKAHAFRLEERVTHLQNEFKKQRETHSSVHKPHVFEREEETEEILNRLLSNQAGDHENVSVIPIFGMGGIGKTTLAKLVFNHERVQNPFDLRMWICVSHDFDVIRLGNEIIKCARGDRSLSDVSNVEELQRRLGETLSGKKFLLVLDDVWNEDPEKWDGLRDLLSCAESGSRIVVTTRSRKVASIMGNIQLHILKPLSEDGCWSLFCQSAFFNPIEEAAHPNLPPIGREIVKKCRGIPLAVKTLGGLLRSERSQRKWEYVRDSEIWNLDDENENGILAERSPIKDPKLMELLENLKDAAYDAPDLLEEYEIANRRRSEEAANSMLVRDTMCKNLKEGSQRLEAIKAKAHAFQLEERVTHSQIEFQKQRETHSMVHKPHVFERGEETEQIVNWLLSNQAGDHENVSVISIVGIEGIGKTTLAKLVYNHERVQNHFDLRMWISVSYDFDVIRLGNEIIKLARNDPSLLDVSNVEQLQRSLRKELDGNRFLLVLDDVWNEDPEKWDRLRDLLLCGGSGSRIIVTTRSAKVASIMSESQPHNLKPLSEDACWFLFCRRAFGNSTKEAVRSKLEPIGRQIVEKCKGNPLAVTTVGGLLQDKRSESRWKSVRDSEMWSLPEETENGILPALRLSYNYLRPHLKQCFAFCAIFPQDYETEKELVIKLWMAHGFIPTDEGMELEDMGNEIFDELVWRSFFQDVKENVKIYKQAGPYSGVYIPDQTTFRMHDLMHDLAHSVIENENRVVLNGKVLNGKSEDISPRIRHISSNGLGNMAASLPTAQKLRTYVMLRNADFQFPCEVGHFKCLRALDFVGQQNKQKVENSQLLTSLGNLQHLRYLNLSFTSIEMLPESLTTLCYLQTLLLIRCTKLRKLPQETSRLTNLRCLDMTDCYKLTYMPPKMGQLSCLQELSTYTVGRTNKIACSGIGELQGLNHHRGSLTFELLKNITDANAMDVPQEYQNLKKLKIFGPNFPNWMIDTTRTALVEITLSRCWSCNHLPPLGELPFLKVLVIEELNNVECVGNEFYGNEVLGGFPSLEVLHIGYMKKLKTWSGLEWKGKRAFPSLVKLILRDCPMLSTLRFFPDIKDVNVDQGMMQSLKNQKSFETMHQQNCNQSSFDDEDQIRSQSSLQELVIQHCSKLNFSSLGLRCFSSLKTLTIIYSDGFVHMAHELSFLTSLEVLRLDSCYDLSSLPEGIGNLTSLQDLVLRDCPKVKSLPRELQRLSALKRLSIYNCPLLMTRCTKETGEDWVKIQHIPDIRFEVNHIARY